ncbi:MAG: Ldh family oxidoreductase [Firmicutes bacterium]|nr:Ldh family oxidoreductase [Bacillota bacterium]
MKRSAGELKTFAAEVLAKAGLKSEDAAVVAETLVFADLRGLESHGVSRLPIYVKRIKKGLVNARATMRMVNEDGAIALLDADNGPGQVASVKAMDIAMGLAQKQGLGACGVRNSTHCGALAYYTLRAVEHGMIGLAMTNANSVMAPWGGREPVLGTNPISVAAPVGHGEPYVMDMATSAVARGKIMIYAKKGARIPLGWGMNEEGEPTEDPNEALKGAMMPMAGPKGYALSLLVDILSGVLTGSAFGKGIGALYDDFSKPQRSGHFFLAIDIGHLMPPELFQPRMDEIVGQIKTSKPARGVEQVLIPGEPEFAAERKRRREGIELVPKVREELLALKEELGVAAEI